MGSDFVTYEWAAARLQKSKRTVHNYCNDGFLTRCRENGAAVLRRDEVEALRLELEGNSRTITRKTVIVLEQRVKRLEDEMNAVKHILEIRDSPLRPSNEEAAMLLHEAFEALVRKEWTFQEVQLWATQFDRMDEVTFEVVASAAPDTLKPWETFYRLCLALMKSVEGASGIETAALWHRLDEGRKKLRASVLVWVELNRGKDLQERVFADLDTPKERLVRRVAAPPRL